MTTDAITAVLNRDRAVVAGGLSLLVLLAWGYLLYMAHDMHTSMQPGDTGMGMQMTMTDPRPWGLVDLSVVFVMWTIMQVAMMIPSASPMILMFAKLTRQRLGDSSPLRLTAVFVLGYIIVWTSFSAAAALTQWGLHSAALLSPMMQTTSSVFAGSLLVGAGIFQFTPLKYACLQHCRSPLSFFLTEWREGAAGALRMGLRHGAFCVGCCWMLMALLFVAGVMNLLWIAVIAVYVLLEKVVPRGHVVSRVLGVGIIAGGAWMIATG